MGTYTNSLTITPVDGDINSPVWVRFSPVAAIAYDGDIPVSGGGATTVNIAAVGTGINTAVAVTTGSASGISATGATVAATLVAGCSTITAYGIEYSITNGFANGAGTQVAGSNLAAGAYSVAISGLSANTTYYFKGYATDATGTVYGIQGSFTTSQLDAPVATAATAATTTGFTANWNAVTGATGYELDVYKVVAGANATDLIISEYVEGNSNEKYIEIFNGTGASIDLSDYSIKLYANGAVTASATQVLSGTLANGSVLVYRNSGATINTSFATSGVVNYNGDDALALVKGAPEVFVDIFGVIGNDPGANWTSGAFQTTNQTLRRKATVSGGVTVNPAGTGVGAFTTLGTEWDTYAIDTVDGLGSHTFSGGASNTYVLQNQAVGNVTTYAVTGLDPQTEYFYVVRAISTNSTSANSNEIAVTTLDDSTTWNGAVWSNGTPTTGLDAIIAGNYNTATNGGFTARTLTVNSGTFTIAEDGTSPAVDNSVTVVNAITNNAAAANFIVANNAVLLQTSDAANTGNITVNRDSSPLYRQDYTLWSAPVTGQNLRNFSTQTLFNRFSGYNTTANAYAQLLFTTNDMNTINFEPGQGYLIRMPNNWTEYNTVTPVPGTPYQGVFVGTPNNGPKTVNISAAGLGYNLIGNPYPSPISVSGFFADNAGVQQTIYFWRKRNGVAGSGYATSTGMGTTSAHPSFNGLNIENTIAVGQGFLIKSTGATAVTFNNDIRGDHSGPLFFRNPTEKHRMWLNLSNATDVVGQTLLGYIDGATQGFDNGIDGLYFDDSAIALTSLIGDATYAIQGRSMPFEATDMVPLQFKTDAAGSYTITLSQFDGLFNGDQDIFLKDLQTNTEHDLKGAPYTFATEAGMFNNRFQVVYQQSTLGIDNPDAVTSIVVYTQDRQLMVNAGVQNMTTVSLYDISGRLVFTQSAIHASQVALTAVPKQQVLMMKITMDNGNNIWKKIIY